VSSTRQVSLWCVATGAAAAAAAGAGGVTIVGHSADLLPSSSPSDVVLAMVAGPSRAADTLCHVYIISAGGYIVKASVDCVSGQVCPVLRCRQVNWVPTPYSFFSVLPCPAGLLLCLSSGEELVTYIETLPSESAAAPGVGSNDPASCLEQDIECCISPVAGVTAVVIMRDGIRQIFLDEAAAAQAMTAEQHTGICTYAAVAQRSGSVSCLEIQSRPGVVTQTQTDGEGEGSPREGSPRPPRACWLQAATAAVIGSVAAAERSTSQMGLAVDDLGLILFHHYSIPPSDSDNFSGQHNRYLLKAHVGFSAAPSPVCERMWSQRGDKLVDILFDFICFPSQYDHATSCGSLFGFPLALLHSALSHRPPSYVSDSFARTEECLESGFGHRRRSSVDKTRPMTEATMAIFSPGDSTAITETADIFVRAAFLVSDAIDSAHGQAGQEIDKGQPLPRDRGSAREAVGQLCKRLVAQYQFASVSSHLKYMGGLESLLSISQDGNSDTNIFLRLLYVLDGEKG
jgi:hypothetical protein